MPLVDQGALGGIGQALSQGVDSYLGAQEKQKQRDREAMIQKTELEAKGYTKDEITGRLVRTPEFLAEEKRKLDNEATVSGAKQAFEMKRDAAKADLDFNRQKELKQLEIDAQKGLKGSEFANQLKLKGVEGRQALQREALQQGMGYIDPKTGEFVAGAPQGQGQPGALTAKSRKDINDQAWNSANFAKSMEEAETVFKSLKDQGYSAESRGAQMRRGAADLPLVGGLLSQAQSGPDRQQSQAERSFVNAVLRKESGAAISPTEFENAALQYFPRAGDTPQVLAQKEQNRAQRIEAFKAQAGNAYGAIPTVASSTLPSQKKGGLLKSADAKQSDHLDSLSDAELEKLWKAKKGK